MNKTIKIVGIGMDGSDTMTLAGRRAVENADLLIGAGRMLAPFRDYKKPTLESYRSDVIAKHIIGCEQENIVVLVSGDGGFYSAAQRLLPLLDGLDVEVICGIASPISFCAKLKMPWSDVHFVSLHGMEGNIVRNVCAYEKTFFLLGGKVTPSDICRRLCEYGRNHVRVHIGENLSMENERIVSGAAEEFTRLETGGLCVMLTENPYYERHLPSGIADDAFLRGKVPMTKAEVRCLCVAQLAIGRSDVCWDIGCGTGSISVEMAVRCGDGRVYAVDKNDEAIALTDQNRRKFGCDNIVLIHDSAERAAAELPAPDCVFIGGSGGHIRELLAAACQKNPHCKIVVTAVSLETLSEGRAALEESGLETEITQIAVTRTGKIGSHTMLSAENPIFILKRKFV